MIKLGFQLVSFALPTSLALPIAPIVLPLFKFDFKRRIKFEHDLVIGRFLQNL
jgi:hypothetical protein